MRLTCGNSPVRQHRMRPFAALVLLFCMVFSLIAYAAVYPVASGTNVISKNGTVIDASNVSDGYVIIRHEAGKKRLKLRIIKGKSTMTYDLNNNGEDEVFPLQLGSGSYEFAVYMQSSGNKYSKASSTKLDVTLSDEKAPFLCPSQYVKYTADSPCVLDADALCEGLATDKEKFDAIYDALSKRMVYDYIKAVQVQSGYLPDINDTYDKQMGICFDLSAIMCAMLRSQGVPVQLVIGTADKMYHAWNMVWLDGEWQLYDLTMTVTGGKVKKYATERYY